MDSRSCASSKFLVVGLVFLAICAGTAYAQSLSHTTQTSTIETGKCTDELLTGYVIRSTKINARYLPAGTVRLPAPKAPYSPQVETDVLHEVQKVLKGEENREDVSGATEFEILKTVTLGKTPEAGTAPTVQAMFIDTCVKPVKPTDCAAELGPENSKCVDIVVRPIRVRIDTSSVWGNLLNIARSNAPTFFSNVPGPLLALKPKLGIDSDRRFGLSQVFSAATNLLDLKKNLANEPVKPRRTRLDLETNGRKSLNERFYETNAKLSLSHRLTAPFDTIALDAGFVGDHQPLGEGDYLKNAGTVGGRLKLHSGIGLLSSVTLGGRYRWSSNRFSGVSIAPELTPENAFEARVIADGHLGTGVTRVAVWADVAAPSKSDRSYHRVAGMAAYSKEFLVAPNQTIGVEAVLGGGRAWGEVPRYARFYGGNTSKSFLYEPDDSPILVAFPTGPLLRSFGSGQAEARANSKSTTGGTSYWHLNMNVAVPVRAWSKPLVPDIIIPDFPVKNDDGTVTVEDRPVRALLKYQGESAINNLRRVYVKEGLSREEADKKARKELSGVNSMLAFLADAANIYSIKPLLMFDAGCVRTPGDLGNRTRAAFGGGVQLTVVTAKFEAGYIRTVRSVPGDGKGNFLLRLVFQNLF
jgi:hypothetical protein